MRLLITRPMPAPVLARAEAAFDVVARPDTTPMSAREMRDSLMGYDAVLPTLGDLYGAEIFAACPNPRARVLANFGVGFGHIDITAAARAGIAVSNTPGAVTDATADIAMTLLLMSARRAGEGERMLRRGAWQGWHPTQMLGAHVSGKHIGIIGMGRIGQAIARRAHFGFGMRVSYFNRSHKDLAFEATRMDLLDLAGAVDFLVVAVPGGAATTHLINAEVLLAMRPHAHLVNIARGEVVDEAALIAALERGQIAGAGLDVYEYEPNVPPALLAMEQVALLPHLGTATEEVRIEMGMLALDNLESFAAGRGLVTPVTP